MSRPRSLLLLLLLWVGCQSPSSPEAPSPDPSSPDSLLQSYATVRLDPDLGARSEAQAEMAQHLIEAAQSMDVIFWEQAYGNRDSLLQTIGDPQRRRLVEINYGPWTRLSNGLPFVDGVGPRPPGANFYPRDVTRDELEQAAVSTDGIDNPYTMVRRLPDGSLTALPYHRFFAEPVTTAAFQLRDAARRAESAAVRSFLERRADALSTGKYATDPPAQSTAFDVVIGPMDTGEDRLLGVKTSAAALVLHRNVKAQQRVDALVERFPALWSELSLPAEVEATLQDPIPSVGAYDVLYAAGAANAGPKPLTLSRLTVNVSSASERHVLFPNLVQARSDSILQPLADAAIAAKQRSHVTAEALSAQTAYCELARLALRGPAPDSALTIGAVDVLGRSLAARAEDAGDEASIEAYTTTLASLLHRLRRDTSNVSGRAALLQFNVLRDRGAITYDEATGTYAVAPAAMREVLPALARRLLALRQAERDETSAFLKDHNAVSPNLRTVLARLSDRPLALAFEQGPSVLRGLTPAVVQ